MRAALERWLLHRWYGSAGLLLLLLPLEFLYRVIVSRRLPRLRENPPLPVIIVGNITVGGAGKTPLVVALIEACVARGLRVGVISRGYGGSGPFPLQVGKTTSPSQCGDEPALIAQRTGAAMVVDPRRRRALKTVCLQPLDLVISDDGLQHYALPRSTEIVVIDNKRRFGNGHCLPIGPLREPPSRLRRIDFVVGNGGDAGCGAIVMQLVPRGLVSLGSGERLAPEEFRARFGSTISAVAGIGDPLRFFASLRALGFSVEGHAFPDHHDFHAGDFTALAGKVVVMTEKDAVKCRAIPGLWAWFLAVDAVLPPGFVDSVLVRAGVVAGKPHS